MDCDKAKGLLPFMDDGPEGNASASDVWSHLNNCSSCREEYEGISKVLNLIERVTADGQIETVPGYLGLVRNKISAKKQSGTYYFRALSVAAVVMLMVSVTLSAFMYFNQNTSVIENYAQTETSVEIDGYLDTVSFSDYDVEEMVEVDDSLDEDIMLTALANNSLDNITPEDIIDCMSDDELAMLFASLDR